MDSPALLEEAVGDGHAVVWLPGGSGVVRTLAPAKSLGIFRKIKFNNRTLPVNPAHHSNKNDNCKTS